MIRLRTIWRIAILKTLFINIRTVGLYGLIKLPILISKGTELRNIGRIKFDCPLKPALFSIGIYQLVTDSVHNFSVWDNNGTVLIKGKVILASGSHIRVDNNGLLSFGDNVRINSNNIVIATHKIEFGNMNQFSWNCQVTDGDMHYIKNLMKLGQNVNPKSKPVKIGDNVWVGNHCIISKGVTLPDGSIVAQSSYVNKTLSEESNCILAGIPAKIIAEKRARIFDQIEENYWDDLYMNHNE